MNALREINVQQSKIGGHIFNIPNTTRIVIQNDGTKALLETDITEGGRLDLEDMSLMRVHVLLLLITLKKMFSWLVNMASHFLTGRIITLRLILGIW